MIGQHWTRVAAIVVALAVPTVAVDAQQRTPKSIGAFGDWAAWELADGKGKVCFLATTPKSSDAKGLKRTVVQIQVSNRPADKVKNEVGVYLGYPVKGGSKVLAEIDKDKFELAPSTQRGYLETAWIHDSRREAELVEAMMKGNQLKVTATPEKGGQTVDTYSLSGVTAGLKAIADRCK